MVNCTSVIRKATLEDAPLILNFIKKIAQYEKQLDKVTCQIEDIKRHFFSEQPIAYAAFVLDECLEVGVGFYYLQFDSLRGKPSIFLHDLFIEEEFRKKGYGHKLMDFLKLEALHFGCEKISWQCYKWDILAQNFYSKIDLSDKIVSKQILNYQYHFSS